jgi:hypothetical protein|tara:strand:+ start:624 stop:1217 length:594 start_codon:yes stop_codon:yes gene_type:complete
MIKWKKFKVQKLPAQKSPDRFASMEASKVAEKSARAKFGEAPEYMGMSTKSMTDMAAESYAMKAENKMFFRTLNKELKASRLKTAGGVKGLRASGKKVPKASIFKAKQKGAMKSLKVAETKSQEAFTKITKRYTDKAKASMFKDRSIVVKPKKINQEGLAAMGLEDRVVSGMRGRTYKTFKNTARGDFNIFKPKKRK